MRKRNSLLELSDLEGEIWADIPGHEGQYQASSMGRIKSLERRSTGEWDRKVPAKILHPTNRKFGLLRVVLYYQGAKEYRYVHRLVLEAFIGNCPDDMEAKHWPDPNPKNNDLSNLCWDHPTKRGDPSRRPHNMNLHGSSFYKGEQKE